MIYILIKDNIVINAIVAEPQFIHDYASKLNVDLCLEFSENDWYPGPGYTYLGDNNFQAPVTGDSNDNGS